MNGAHPQREPLRVIDERGTPAADLYPLAVAGRPFSVQSRIGRKWLGIPGATYATKAEAMAAKRRIAQREYARKTRIPFEDTA